MASHFHKKRFPRIRRDVVTIISTFSSIVLHLFISRALRIFLSYIYGEMRTVFVCSQSNCRWHSFVCSVAPDDSHFLLMLSCWCSMHRSIFDSPFQSNISIKNVSPSLIYFSEHIKCALWRKPLNTLLMALGSMHDVGLICMLVMPFLRCTLNSCWLLMVLVILISKKFKDLFSFSYSMVYWIAGTCLFKISWKVFAWCFDGKQAWLSSTYRLNVFGCICIVRASAIVLRSRCCK